MLCYSVLRFFNVKPRFYISNPLFLRGGLGKFENITSVVIKKATLSDGF